MEDLKLDMSRSTVKVVTHETRCKRYDKLFIDNEPYVWDEEEGRVLPARCVYEMCQPRCTLNFYDHRPKVVFFNSLLPGVFLLTGDLRLYKTSTGGKDKIKKIMLDQIRY